MVVEFLNSFYWKAKIEMGQVFKALTHMAVYIDVKMWSTSGIQYIEVK